MPNPLKPYSDAMEFLDESSSRLRQPLQLTRRESVEDDQESDQPSYIISLIVAVESQQTDLVANVVAIQEALKSLDPTHFFYPPAALHITVLGCTPFVQRREEISDLQTA